MMMTLGEPAPIGRPSTKSLLPSSAAAAKEQKRGQQHLNPLAETEKVRRGAASMRDNPASALVDFLDAQYRCMSCGGLLLDARDAVRDSPRVDGRGTGR